MTLVERTRFGDLRHQYRIDEAIADVRSPIAAGDIVRIPLPVNPEKLIQAVAQIEKRRMFNAFAASNADADRSYENISLTYNPAHEGDPHHSTLGSSTLARNEHYYAGADTIGKIGSVRDSYYDTYGFRVATQAATEELGFLTGRFKRSLVRSRLSIIRAGHRNPSNFDWGWHKDEPVFENLRINIHVTDSDAHRIQIMREDRMPLNPWDAALAEHKFEVGFAHSWDTNIPHRACAIGMPKHDRAAVVYGVSPWFDYNPSTDSWSPNEFFGKKHPLQMLVDGDVL